MQNNILNIPTAIGTITVGHKDLMGDARQTMRLALLQPDSTYYRNNIANNPMFFNQLVSTLVSADDDFTMLSYFTSEEEEDWFDPVAAGWSNDQCVAWYLNNHDRIPKQAWENFRTIAAAGKNFNPDITLGLKSHPVAINISLESLPALIQFEEYVTQTLSTFLRSDKVTNMVMKLERDAGIRQANDYTLPEKTSHGRYAYPKTPFIRSKRGRYGGGTWMHLYLLMEIAATYSAEFSAELYKILLINNHLGLINEGDELYKEMDTIIKGIPVITGENPYYRTQNIANLIADKFGMPSMEECQKQGLTNRWNYAESWQLYQRSIMHHTIINAVRGGLVTTYPALFGFVNAMIVKVPKEIVNLTNAAKGYIDTN